MYIIKGELYNKVFVNQNKETKEMLESQNKTFAQVVFVCNFCKSDFTIEETIIEHLNRCTKRNYRQPLWRRKIIPNLNINGITTLQQAKEIMVSFSTPSKMPCAGYSIDPKNCITGSKLAKLEGTICSKCYALKKSSWYTKGHVTPILERRTQAIKHKDWHWAIIYAIHYYYFELFRWHDAGDLQSVAHLAKIAFIAKQCTFCKFWLPTREYGMIRKFWEMNGEVSLKELYPNLKIILSATEFDKEAPYDLARKLGVSVSEVGKNYTCPAPDQGHKCGECLTPDTLIITNDGLKPIDQVSVGDLVLTHLGRFKPVTKIFKRKYDEDILEIRAYGSSYTSKLTPEHRVLTCFQENKTISGNTKRILNTAQLQWTETKKLKVCERHSEHHYLTFPRFKETVDMEFYTMKIKYLFEIVKEKIKINNDMMKVIGYYLAEGFVGDYHRGLTKNMAKSIHFTFGKSHKEFLYAVDCMDALVRLGYHPRLLYRKGWFLSLFESKLVEFFKQFGNDVYDKHIPFWIQLLPASKLEFLLDSYINGDGHTYKADRIHYTTSASLQLSHGIRLLANKIGYSSYFYSYKQRPTTIIEGRIVNQNTKYCVHMNRNHRSNIRSDGNYLYPKIKELKKIQYTGIVYNLHVEEDESYCTPSFIVHNCRKCWDQDEFSVVYKTQ